MSQGYTILIVDDSRTTRGFIRRTIEMSGFPISEFHEAENGEEALVVLRGQWVDLLLTDINMPKMNGIELLRSLRSTAALKHVPAVVISTDGSDSRKDAAAQLGVSGYLRKPFAPEQLRQVLETALGVAA